MIIVLEYVTLGVVPSRGTLLAVGLMLSGSVIAGAGDLKFDLVSYMFVLANSLATAVYLISMKTASSEVSKQLGNWGVFYYNCVLAVPMLVVWCLFRGSFSAARQFPLLSHPPFIVAYLCSAFLAFFLNYSTFWCTRANSALTTSVTGQTKNILTTLVGVLAFGGVHVTILGALGLLTSVAGSVMYGVVKFNEKRSRTPAPSHANEQRQLLPR